MSQQEQGVPTSLEDLRNEISQLEQELYGLFISGQSLDKNKSNKEVDHQSAPQDETVKLSSNDVSEIVEEERNLFSHLTPEQVEKFEMVKKNLKEATGDHAWVSELDEQQTRYVFDDRSILRALEGYNWSVTSANNVLKRVTTWRMQYKPHEIRMKDLKHVGPNALVHLYGFDRNGRPIIYIHAKNLNISDNSDENVVLKFNYLIYGIERCLYYLPPDQHRLTWIFDMTDAPLSISLVQKLRGMFEQLGDYYPEVINVNIICNVSWTLSLVWRVVSSFISEHVLRRYFVFRSGDSNLESFLHEHIDPSVLLTNLGGPVSNPFHYDKILRLEELLEQLNAKIATVGETEQALNQTSDDLD